MSERAGRAISIADVVVAFAALRPGDDDERRAIARLLGFELDAPAPARPDDGARPPDAAPPPPPPLPEPPPAPPPIATPDEDEPPTEVVRLPDVVHLDVPLPAALPPPPAIAAARAPAPPLFAPEWTSVVMARLGARLARTGAIDLPRLVELVARRSVIRELPRRLQLATAPAVTLVLDRAGAMAWLAADQAQLVVELDALLRVPLEVVESTGAPDVVEPIAAPRRDDRPRATSAGDDPLADVDMQRPVVRTAHGTRVIAVTDLGAGSPWDAPRARAVRGWRTFADDIAARGGSLVVLTPLPPERVPAALRDVALVHWDRRTRPSQVHALVKGLR